MSSFTLTSLEVIGTSALTNWARYDNALGCYLGVLSFGVMGATLGYSIRACKNVAIVNALWQTTSMIVISALSVVVWGEKLDARRALGTVLATLASLCFI